MYDWILASKEKPPCSNDPDALGPEVLVWPRADGATAFYGRRATGKPEFYRFGAVVHVTHWMPLPYPPKVATLTSGEITKVLRISRSQEKRIKAQKGKR